MYTILHKSLSFLPFSKLLFGPESNVVWSRVTTTLTNDWLGSRLKTLYITILRKVNGENVWEVYYWNKTWSKRGRSPLRSIKHGGDQSMGKPQTPTLSSWLIFCVSAPTCATLLMASLACPFYQPGKKPRYKLHSISMAFNVYAQEVGPCVRRRTTWTACIDIYPVLIANAPTPELFWKVVDKY